MDTQNLWRSQLMLLVGTGGGLHGRRGPLAGCSHAARGRASSRRASRRAQRGGGAAARGAANAGAGGGARGHGYARGCRRVEHSSGTSLLKRVQLSNARVLF